MRLLATLPLIISVAAFAYPIPPQSVRELAESSELVVVARVRGVRSKPLSDDVFAPDSVATLDVEETWKGAAVSTLEVAFSSSTSCPAPPRYETGRRVVAFLLRSKGTWETTGLSYGTKYADNSELEALRHEVAAVVAAQRGGSLAPWEDRLVHAFANPETRSDVLVSMQADEKGTRELRDAVLLQFERLFIERPSFDSAVPRVLWLFKTRPSKALDAVFADVIESTLAREPASSWVAESLPMMEARLRMTAPKPGQAKSVEQFEVALGEKQPVDAEVKAKWAAIKRAFKLRPSKR